MGIDRLGVRSRVARYEHTVRSRARSEAECAGAPLHTSTLFVVAHVAKRSAPVRHSTRAHCS